VKFIDRKASRPRENPVGVGGGGERTRVKLDGRNEENSRGR